MLIALLVVLGIDLVVIAAIVTVVSGRRRWLNQQPGAFHSAIRVTNGDLIATLPAGELDRLLADPALIVTPDIVASNGVAHAIDAVPTPGAVMSFRRVRSSGRSTVIAVLEHEPGGQHVRRRNRPRARSASVICTFPRFRVLLLIALVVVAGLWITPVIASFVADLDLEHLAHPSGLTLRRSWCSTRSFRCSPVSRCSPRRRTWRRRTIRTSSSGG